VFPATGAIFTQNEVNIGISGKICPSRPILKFQNHWSTGVSQNYVLRNRNVLVRFDRSKVVESPQIMGILAAETPSDPARFCGRADWNYRLST
jgi:hypothetical protein